MTFQRQAVSHYTHINDILYIAHNLCWTTTMVGLDATTTMVGLQATHALK